MKEAVDTYWEKRLDTCKSALIANRFDAYIAEDTLEAKRIILEKIIPQSNAKTISYAGSLTVVKTGILDAVRDTPELEVVETFRKKQSREEMMNAARYALLVDMFITGSNAVTETGILVNLDMWGNRVGALAYGPQNVIVITGRNKLVPDLEQAMLRIKNYAAPVNAIRHHMNHPRETPCVNTAYCDDCSGDWRICNVWTIHEKSFPEGRIKVILVNEDLGI